MTIGDVIALTVVAVIALNLLVVWFLTRAGHEPTEFDRRCEELDVRLDDIYRGSGRR